MDKWDQEVYRVHLDLPEEEAEGVYADLQGHQAPMENLALLEVGVCPVQMDQLDQKANQVIVGRQDHLVPKENMVM